MEAEKVQPSLSQPPLQLHQDPGLGLCHSTLPPQTSELGVNEVDTRGRARPMLARMAAVAEPTGAEAAVRTLEVLTGGVFAFTWAVVPTYGVPSPLGDSVKDSVYFHKNCLLFKLVKAGVCCLQIRILTDGRSLLLSMTPKPSMVWRCSPNSCSSCGSSALSCLGVGGKHPELVPGMWSLSEHVW